MDYCQVCNRDFSDEHALLQHLRNSAVHVYDCLRCRRHFKSWTAKQEHLNNSRKYDLCRSCGIDFKSSVWREEHMVEEHNKCLHCGKLFDTPSNLQHHRQTHVKKTVQCPGCATYFVSNAAMVLHLEAGACPSGRACDRIDEIASDCGLTDNSEARDYMFECPSCLKDFRYMSALLQHDFSTNCTDGDSYALNDFLDELQWRV